MTQRTEDDHIPMEQINIVTLAVVYYGANQKEKILPIIEERDLHPFVKDTCRALAGKKTRSTKYGKSAKKWAKELIWSNFESVCCSTCDGRTVVGYAYHWKKCPTCKGKGRVMKGKK